MASGMLHNMKLECDLLQQKISMALSSKKYIIFLDARTAKSYFILSSAPVILVLYDLKAKCHLMCQLNKHHLVC